MCSTQGDFFNILVTPQQLFCEVSNPFICDCPPGNILTDKGTYAKCPAGTEPNTGALCTPCRNFQVSKQPASECVSCPVGFIGNKRSGATRCVPCPVRTFREAGSSTCEKCEARENRFIRGAASCQRDETPCASNFFRTRIGTREQCTREERYDRRMNKCVACRPNESTLGGLSTNCTRCPRGAVGSTEGCVCGPGWELGTNGKCQPCKPGTARLASDLLDPFEAFCAPCEGANFIETRGAVAPRPGMESCTLCPPGTRQDDEGQTKCNRLKCTKNLVLNFEKSACVDPATNCPPNSEPVLGSDLSFAC